jgi:hypothetical protein
VTTARRQPAKASTKAPTKASAKAPAKASAKAPPEAAAHAVAGQGTTSEGASRTSPEAGPAGPKAEAIVLTGPPSLLRATVSVENAVDQRVAVRGLTLHRSGQQALTGAGAAVIAPGATAQLPVTFRLEPGTAPGEYAAEVEVGGIRREAVLRVEPDLSLHVSPHRLLAEVGSTPVTLRVTNDGNVPIPLAALVRARTDDGGPDPGPDVTLTLTDATTAAPGTTTVLRGSLAVPSELDPTRRHAARIPVGTADLDVIILPRDPTE